MCIEHDYQGTTKYGAKQNGKLPFIDKSPPKLNEAGKKCQNHELKKIGSKLHHSPSVGAELLK